MDRRSHEARDEGLANLCSSAVWRHRGDPKSGSASAVVSTMERRRGGLGDPREGRRGAPAPTQAPSRSPGDAVPGRRRARPVTHDALTRQTDAASRAASAASPGAEPLAGTTTSASAPPRSARAGGRSRPRAERVPREPCTLQDDARASSGARRGRSGSALRRRARSGGAPRARPSRGPGDALPSRDRCPRPPHERDAGQRQRSRARGPRRVGARLRGLTLTPRRASSPSAAERGPGAGVRSRGRCRGSRRRAAAERRQESQ